MPPSLAVPPVTPAFAAPRTPLRVTYFIEAVLSFAANLLFVGIFFYTTHVFGGGLVRNFCLAAGQGAVYVVASLASQGLARRIGDRRLLLGANVALAVVAAVGVVATQPALLTLVIVVYVPLVALNWPVLEAASVADADPHEMSRRIGVYNLVWAGTGALAVAVQGKLIAMDPRMVFFVPLLIHLAIVGVILCVRRYGVRRIDAAPMDAHAHPEPEPDLLRQRTLALWLSRIALPSTYVVIYSLSALMPLLPVMGRLDTTLETVVGAVWMASRFVMFFVLGATVFWHTRPRLLLAAAVTMGVAFVGVTSLDTVAGVIAAQVLLGVALGLIYTASLYFGMVLSDGSAEHAGYHEALIGLGQVLGPGAGALTQWRWPGSLRAGVVAVSSLAMVSIVAAFVAAAKARRRD
jgi:hypothetical protein